MRAAIYARVSTSDQRAELQLGALREYTARQGWGAAEFVDQGVSGSRAKRPALDMMLDAVHRRSVDAVVVTKLDRLGRSVRHLCDLAADRGSAPPEFHSAVITHGVHQGDFRRHYSSSTDEHFKEQTWLLVS
jgi:hypothetical protein